MERMSPGSSARARTVGGQGEEDPDKDGRAEYVRRNVPGHCSTIFACLVPEFKDTEFADHRRVAVHPAPERATDSSPSTAPTSACRSRTTCATSPAAARRCARSASGWSTAAWSWSLPQAIIGYQSYVTKEGSYEGYAAVSITDPGNADGVITVGATHRYWPHTYGVSFFSSRGPTGDGRSKPDLVAPGERIHAPFGARAAGMGRTRWHQHGGTARQRRRRDADGALFRIDRAAAASSESSARRATDLGRERNFQGHGMLDVLRAFQSI